MKLILLVMLVVAFITSSCNHGHGSGNGCNEMNNQVDETIVAEILSRNIIEFIVDNKHIDSTGVKRVFSLEFIIDSEYTSPSRKEEVLLVSTLGCNYDSMAYMGLFSISNTLVAVFDRNRIGSAFYNYDKLMNIPLQSLRCEHTEMRVARTFIIKDSLLIHWH